MNVWLSCPPCEVNRPRLSEARVMIFFFFSHREERGMEWKRTNKKKKKRLEKYEELRRRGGTKTSLRRSGAMEGRLRD